MFANIRKAFRDIHFRDTDTLAIDSPEDRKPNHKTSPSFNTAQMVLLNIGGTAAGQAFGMNRHR
jgi:hypothetical protein